MVGEGGRLPLCNRVALMATCIGHDLCVVGHVCGAGGCCEWRSSACLVRWCVPMVVVVWERVPVLLVTGVGSYILRLHGDLKCIGVVGEVRRGVGIAFNPFRFDNSPGGGQSYPSRCCFSGRGEVDGDAVDR